MQSKIESDEVLNKKQVRLWMDAVKSLGQNVQKIKELIQRNESEKTFYESDPRFSLVQFPFQNLTELAEKNRQNIVIWCGRMVKQIMSTAFQKFYEGKLSQKQTKCYASENFIFNFLRMSKFVKLQVEELQLIDQKLKQIILPYIQTKYPQLQNTEVNLSLSNRIEKIDDLQNNQNDLFFRSQVKFELSEKKHYNSQIMKFLNYVITIPSKKIPSKFKIKHLTSVQEEVTEQLNQIDQTQQQEKTIYASFYSYFENLFEGLYEKQKVDIMGEEIVKRQIQQLKINQKTSCASIQKKKFNMQIQNQEKNQRQKLKYKEKVQQYTKYFIGRKLSQNIQPFQDDEIKDGNLKLKSSALMRVVTKWCRKLRQNFKKPHEVAHNHGQFRMKDGSQRYLCSAQAQILEKLLRRRQKYIEIWLKSVRKNNFKHQVIFSQQNFADQVDIAILSEQESNTGMYASVNHKNYEFYLIGYLKELIHNLLTVMSEFEAVSFYHKYRSSDESWEKILHRDIDEVIENGKNRKKELNQSMDSKTMNLINFKVSDLLRCKCSSKQREINALYNQIQRVSKMNPKDLKVVRVKNRLERGTQDVLINILFKKTILIQVQLAIDRNKSKFIDCSDKFKHFVYEVNRSQFGPVSQFCSIFMHNDSRADFLLKCFESRNKVIQDTKSKKQPYDSLQQIKFPFQCQICKKYTTVSFSGSNKCLNCDIGQKSYQQVQEIYPRLPIFPEINSAQTKRFLFRGSDGVKKNFPEFGLVMKINTEEKQIKYFKCIKKGGKIFVMTEEQDRSFRNLGEVTTKQQQRDFLQENLVFTHSEFEYKAKSILDQEVNKNYFIPQIFSEVKNKQKNSMRIVHEQLSDRQIQLIREQIKSVEKVNLSENRLCKITSIAEIFPKVKVLILNENNINSLRGWEQLEYLEELSLEHNKINFLNISKKNSEEKILKLKKLYLNSNQIENLQSSILSLRKLQKLQLNSNLLKSLPEEFGQLNQIEKLYLNSNKIQVLPESILNLKKLHFLFLNSNQLKNLPPEISGLDSLEILQLNNNQLTCLPESFGMLKNLQKLYLNYNELQYLPYNFGQISLLATLEINGNRLSKLPKSFKDLQQLKRLYLNDNAFDAFPEAILYLQNLEKLELNSLKKNNFPDSLKSLKNLQKLYLNSDSLEKLPKGILQLVNIQTLSIGNNHLSGFDESFDNLKKLQKLYLNSNNLRELPTSILAINSLNVLNLDDNQLQSLPENLKALKNLKTLYLKGNLLSELPNSFGLLKNLQKVYLTKNNLRHLPESFRLLENLQKIYLSSNKFTEIPDPILSLNNLQTLDLKQNGLLHLPQSIKNLKKLQTLYLQFNKLETLPNSLIQLDNLQELQINENKLDEAGKKIYNKVKKFRVM